MKRFITLFFVFIFYYLQCNCIPQVIKEKNNSPKDISAFAKVMLKEFTPNDGLPQSSIMAMTTDKLGRLWIGTQDGAAFYNGRKWTIVNLPNRNNSNYIQSMYAADDGSIWISANRGQVHKFKNGKWQSFDTSNGLASRVINSIKGSDDKNGEKIFWFGTNMGVSKYSKGKWETFNSRNSKLKSDIINDICISGDGSPWFATGKGVSHYSGGNFNDFPLPKEFWGKGINRITTGRNGVLWFAGEGLIGKYKDGNWSLIHVKELKTDNRSTVLFESSAGELWIGTEMGIMSIPSIGDADSSTQIREFYSGTDFANKMGSIFCIHESNAGVIWFGTLLGLYRYIPGKWVSLNEQTGLPGTPVTYIYENSYDSYFFGTPRGLVQYSDGKWKIFNDKSGLSNNFVKAVLKSKDGALWVGTLGGGANRFYNGKWKIFDTRNGLADNRVYSIIQSDDGAMWFSTAKGVSKYFKDQWVTYTTVDGLASNQVMSLFQSKDGSIWFGTRSGLSRLHLGRWDTFSAGNSPVEKVIQSINCSSDGNLWFGTFSGGIYRFDPKTLIWKTYNDATSPALANNVIYQEEEDREGSLYFLTNKGVTRISPSEFNFPDKEKSPEVFTMEDGLASNEGMVRASLVDSKGRIWVGTTKGASFFDPVLEIPDTMKKRLLIENVSIQNSPGKFDVFNGITLAYYQNNLSFEFALLSFFKESNSLYQTQLEPYESSPSGWTNLYTKGYTNLSPGKYKFLVWGKDYAGNVSGPTEFHFIIQPPFWMEWWFIGFLFLIFLGIIYLTIRFITTQKLKKQLALLERQKLIEHERGRISKDMHDTVGSSLTRIAILSDRVGKQVKEQSPSNDKQAAIQDGTELIGTTAREVIDTMNEIIWSLSPKQDNLESLINYTRHFINSMFEDIAIRYTLDIHELVPNIELGPDFRRNVFLIIKEIINNIVKHSSASNVSLSISLSDGNLNFIAVDDGIGIVESSSIDKRTGFGLKNMRERADSIGAKLEIESILNHGTTIRVCAPLKTFPPI